MNFITYGILSLIIGIMLMLSGVPGDVLGVLFFIGGTILIIKGRINEKNNGSD